MHLETVTPHGIPQSPPRKPRPDLDAVSPEELKLEIAESAGATLGSLRDALLNFSGPADGATGRADGNGTDDDSGSFGYADVPATPERLAEERRSDDSDSYAYAEALVSPAP